MKFTCPACAKQFEAGRPTQDERLRCSACGHEFADPDATVADELGPLAAGGLSAGKELAGFRIEDKVGTGAMGEVYKATQLSLNRTVALKVLPTAFADRPAFVQRFYQESMALSALNHPNIVTIIDRGNIGRIYFFVMEYVEGSTLAQLMSRHFDVEEVVRIAQGTARALEYAHKHGVVHRDIKPSNIMLTAELEVKIADFGLAGLIAQERKVLESGSERPRRMGTPAYMSPEQKADPIAVDGRTDIFAAGVVLHELIARKRPDIPLRQMPSEPCEDADPRLDPIIAKCLQVAPEERYQDAADLLADLDRFAAELARAPRCPKCGKLGPVRALQCVHCGQDLDQFFDLCPECKHKNRRDVRHCLACGADLEKGRTLVSSRVSLVLDQADRLRLNANFDEGLRVLSEVQGVEGRAFEAHRHRADVLRDRILAERRQAAQRAYTEAKRLVREQRFAEAIQLFQSVPKDLKDTTKAVKSTLQLQARIAAGRRAQTVTNLIFIAIGLIMLMAAAMAALARLLH
jgi:hypothetical protein